MIAWSSNKQPTVALSSMETEYRGATVATCKVIWLKRVLWDLLTEMYDPRTIYYENLSSIHLAKNLVFHARTKHIEVHYHFFHKCVLSSGVELAYVPTGRHVADIFTNPLGLDKLRHFSSELGLRHLDTPNLRGRQEEQEEKRERSGIACDVKSDEEFYFMLVEETEEENRGCNHKKESKITGQGGDIAKKGVKAKTKTWSNVVKGLKTEGELETANSGKSAIETEVTDSIEIFDSDIMKQLRAKQRKGQWKRRQHRDSKGAEKGHTIRQAG